MTSAIARYIADAPQRIPSHPAMFPMTLLPDQDDIARSRNRTTSVMNTSCSARFLLKVANHIPRVKTPHTRKYHPMKAGEFFGRAGSTRINTRVNQKDP